MAMISKLMPHYGGAITNEEWSDTNIRKETIERFDERIFCEESYTAYFFLAFHTKEQRDEFLEKNEQLVKDYLMISATNGEEDAATPNS